VIVVVRETYISVFQRIDMFCIIMIQLLFWLQNFGYTFRLFSCFWSG